MHERPFAVAFLAAFSVIGALFVAKLIEIPEWTKLNVGLVSLAAVICLMNYVNEYHGLFQLSYSKFSSKSSGLINARVGWTITYGLPVVVYIALWVYQGMPYRHIHKIALASYVAHFVKRILECIFLHKYSRDIELSSVIEIGAFYSLGAVIQHYWCNMYTSDTTAQRLSNNQLLITAGLIVYAIGEMTNFQHHLILANLRPVGSAAGKYAVPTGGLFDVAICPHYFGELMAWLGMAIAGQHFALYLSWLTMVAYLAGRSHQTRHWYIKKIENFPQDRWNLLPGIY